MKNNFSKQWDAGGGSRSIIQGLNLFTSRNLFKSLKSILMVVALLSLSSNVWADYTVTFNTAGSDGSNVSTKVSDYVNSSSTSYVSSITTSKAYYNGKSGVKLGASSNTGNITLNLSTTGQITASSISIVSAAYDSGKTFKCTVTYTDNTSINQTFSFGASSTSISLTSSKTVKSVKFESITSSKGRGYISSFTIAAAASKKTVDFECNGATSGCPSKMTEQTNLPNPLPTTQQKTGYSFGGWYTNSGLTNAAQAGAVLTENTTLYAKWNIINRTVTYNGDGQLIYTEQPTTATIEDAGIEVTYSVNTGYEITGVSVTMGGTDLVENTDFTWDQDEVFIMPDDGNGITGNIVVTFTVQATSPETKIIYLRPNANWLSNSGGQKFSVYNISSGQFIDFMTESACAPGVYSLEILASITQVIFVRHNITATTPSWADGNKWNQTGNLTIPGSNNLFTIPDDAWDGSTTTWSTYAEPQYSVTCHPNGGDGGDVVVSNKACGDKVNLASTPTRTGWTFLGWYDGSGNHHNAGEEVTVSGNMQYWAHWEAYVLHGNFTGSWTDNHFYVNNDYADIALAANTTYEFGIAYRKTDKDDVWKGQTGTSSMTRGNSTWTLNGSNNVKITADVAGTYRFAYNTSTASMTVTYPEKVTVTYDGNDNTSGSAPAAVDYAKGATVTVAGNTGSLAKTGYDFGGWNTNASGTGTNYTAGSGTFIINANTPLYAKWTIKNYTVTKGTVTGGSATVPSSVNHGGNVTLTGLTPDANHKLPYTITVTGNYGSIDGAIIKNVTSAITVNVSFAEKAQYTVTYYNGTTQVGTKQVAEGEPIGALNNGSTLSPLSVTNTRFIGWTETPFDGKITTRPTLVDASTVVNAAMDLYAVWGYTSTKYAWLGADEDLVSGDYIITYGTAAMNTTLTSGQLGKTTITSEEVSEGWVAPQNGIVWRITVSGNTATIYNVATGKFLNITSSSLEYVDTPVWLTYTSTKDEYNDENKIAFSTSNGKLYYTGSVFQRNSSADNFILYKLQVYSYSTRTPATHTVTWSVMGSNLPASSDYSGTVEDGDAFEDLSIPEDPSATEVTCADAFIGWATAAITKDEATESDVQWVDEEAIIHSDVTYYAVFAQAEEGEETTLVNFTGGTSSDLTSLEYVSANGLGSDYAEVNAPYRVKLDGTGDYILLSLPSVPTNISIAVKMLGGATASSITLQESATADGTFTNVETMSISGSQNDVVEWTSTETFTQKYIKLYFTKGSNVGLGGLQVQAGGTSYSNYATSCPELKYATIEFNANGKTLADGSMPEDITNAVVGRATTLPGCSATVTGYTFAGWSATQAGSVITEYTPLDEDQTYTMYAKWTPKTVTITWNANGGSVEPATSQYTYDGAIVELPTPTTTAEQKFVGWFTAKTDGTQITEIGTTNKPAANVTYFAQWRDITWTDYLTDCGTAYNITLVDDGTKTGGNTFSTSPAGSAIGGSTVTLTATPNSCYNFTSWDVYKTGESSTKVDVDGNTFEMPEYDVTVDATFTRIDYVISYELQGGGAPQGSSETYGNVNVGCGNTWTAPDDPVKTGYDFAGWYNGATPVTTGYEPTGNCTLTAHWTAQTYTITYKDRNDAAFSGTNYDALPKTHTYGIDTPIPDAEVDEDHNFQGWWWDAACTSNQFTGGVLTGTAVTTNVTLYAKILSKACNNQYSFHWGGSDVKENNNFLCFSLIEGTKHEIANYVIEDASDVHKYFVGYNGFFYDGELGSAHAKSFANDVKYMPFEATMGEGDRPQIGNNATGAVGTLRIYDNSGWDNLYLTFRPNGYGLMYGATGTENKIAFNEISATVWRTAPVELTADMKKTDNSFKYQVGLLKSDDDYTACGHGEAARFGDMGSYCSTWGPEGTGGWGENLSEYAAGRWGYFEIWIDNVAKNWCCHFTPMYRLHYDLDGGENANIHDEFRSYAQSGTDLNTTVTTEVPVRDGYTFLGWKKGADPIAADATVAINADNVVITAQWAQNFTVTYDLEGYSTSCSSSTVHYCGETGIVVCEAPDDKTGYTFMGWNTDDITGSPADYTPGATFTMPCNNVVFTADYQADSYTITYEGLEGASNTNPATYTIESNITFVNPGAREGYTFTGWTENSTPITGITAGTTGIKTITANWSLNSHSVTFDANGYGVAPTGYANVNYGALVTKPTDPADVDESGDIYSFIGWYKEAGCTSAWNFATDVMPDNDLTLYAKWSSVTYEDYRTHCCTPLDAPTGGVANNITMTTATLSWNAVTGNNGYQVSADQANWVNVLSGESHNLTDLTPGTHYIYYVRAKGDNDEYCQYGTTAQIEFTTKAALHITYKANGGTGADVVSEVIEEGTSATVAANTFTAPTGMTFNGWNTATDGTGTAYDEGDEINHLNADLTLYAQWKGETYNITYNLNDGAWNGAAGAATYEFGTGIAALATNVEKSGFRFDGWYSNAGLTEGPVTSIGADATGDKEFWAKWTAVYAITYTIPSGGGILATDAQISAASGEKVTMPGLQDAVPSPYDCETLIGWTTSSSFESKTGAMPDPFYAVGAKSPVISGATTFYAVYSRPGQGASGTISLTNQEISDNWGTSAGASGYDFLKTITNTAGTWSSNGYAQNGNKFIQIKPGAYYLSIPEQPGNLTTITITHNSNSSERTVFLTSSTSTTPQLASQAIPAYQTTTEFDVSDANVKGGYIYCTAYTLQIQSVTATYGAPNIISTELNCSNDILEFTVTYNANAGQFPGATTACESPDEHTFNGDDPETNPYTICSSATCEGMTLIGWNSQADGQGGLNYTPGQVISNVSQEEITLYAQFVYNVNVKDNDDFQENVHPSERGGAINLDGGNDVCSPAKYAFIGWTTDNPATWKQTITSPIIFSSDKVTTYTPTAAGTQVTAVYGMSTSVGSQAFYISYNDGSTVHYLKFNGESVSQTTNEAEATAMYRETINSSENKYHLYYMNNGVKTYFYYNGTSLSTDDGELAANYGWTITTDGSGVSTFQSIIASGRYLSYSSSFTTHAAANKVPLTITTGAKEYKYYDETTCTDEITITFNAGGGTMDPVTTQIVGHEGDVITVPECSYPGWTWIGWVNTPAEAQSDIKIADENIYTNEDGHEYEIGSQNETLYAYYTRTPVPPTFDGEISDVWKIYVTTVDGGGNYIYHYEVGAKDITKATAHGEYATTTRCIEATDWAFTNVGTNQFTIQNPAGLYLRGDPAGDENDIYFRATPSVWTMEDKGSGFYKFVNENTPTRYLAFRINNGDPTFINTSTTNESNSSYSYVKVGGCTDQVYTTSPGGEFKLNMLGNVRVTSTNTKTVRSVDALSISADNLTPNTAITLTDNLGVLAFCNATGGALSLTTDGTGKLANTAVYVKYTPTAYNTTDMPTITATCGEQHQDFAGLVTGRSLPEKFIIAQKVGDDWYALPNNMTNSQTNPAAVKLLSVDEAAGTATIYSDVTDHLAWTMDVTTQEANKNTLEFVSALTGYLKVAETDANTIGQYAQQSSVKQNYTEFLPATTDLIDYTLYNNARSKYVGINSTVWGVYSDVATVRFLAIDQKPAVNLTLSGDVVLTSANGIEVYGNQTSNLLHISANYTNVAKLRYTYNDGTSDVTVSNSVFRLNYYGFPDKTDYHKADATAANHKIDVNSLTGEVDQTFSVSLTPAAANTTYNYTLTIAALDANNNVMEEKQITLKGRSLPEQFVIAMKNTSDNKWYALPNDLATSTSGSSSTKAPLLISVDNTTTPTKALMAPKNTLYKGDSRYQPNSHRNAIRFLRADATKNAWITTSSTLTLSLLYMPDNGSDNQQFNLLSSDLAAYTIKQDDDTRTIAMYGGTIGWYDSGSTKTVYLLPVDASAEDAVFDIVEWFPTKLLIESSQAIETTSVQVGDAEAIVATASTATYGTHLYEVQTGDLTAKAGQAMSVSYTIEATTYAKVVTVPIILSRGTYATSGSVFGGLDAQSKYRYNDLVVRDGATLTVDATTGTHNTFKNVTIYPTSKVIVPAKATGDDTKEVTMTTTTMTLFGGTDEIYNGSAYMLTKYGVPQLVLNGKLEHNETTSGLVYDVRVDKAQYYNFALPYTSKYELVTDNKGGEDFTFWTKIYDGETRAAGNNGWVWYDWDADPWAINIGTGYMFAAQPYSGQNYIIIRHPMGYYNAGEDPYAKNEGGHQSGTAEATNAAVDVYAYPSKYANNAGWNYIANPFMANFTKDLGDGCTGTIQTGQLVEHKVNEKWDGHYEWKAGSLSVRYVTLYNNGTDTYEQLPMSTAVLAPFTGFFVQMAEGGQIVFDISGRTNSAPARMLSEDELPSEMEIFLHAAGQGQKDETVLFLSNGLQRDNAKEFPNEMTKQENAGTLNFYTYGGETKMYANGMSYTDGQTWSNAGLMVAKEGSYTFSVTGADNEHVSHVILRDKYSNTEYDLKHTDAEIYLEAGEVNDRFDVKLVLDEHGVTTELDNVHNNNNPEKFIYNDKMFIRVNGRIYDATGKRVNK